MLYNWESGNAHNQRRHKEKCIEDDDVQDSYRDSDGEDGGHNEDDNLR